MLRDTSGNGGGRPSTPRNVLGDRLEICSINPMTGFFRNGCCDTAPEDVGSHTVCVVLTDEFLAFSKSRGKMVCVRNANSAGIELAHQLPRCGPCLLTLGADTTVGASAEIIAAKPEQPAKRNAVFWVYEQLEKCHTLLGDDAIEITLVIVALAGYAT